MSERLARASSVALIETADNCLLLEHRPEGIRCGGKYSLFGGGGESGETPEQTIRRELLEEIETPDGVDRDLTRVEQVWSDGVKGASVTLFLVRLACRAEEVRLHRSLRATGTGMLALPFDTYPVGDTTMFTWRALVAHSTGDYGQL